MIITDKAGLLGRPHTWPPWNTVRLNALNDEWMLFVINHTEKTRWQKIDLLVVVFYLWATNFFTSIIILFNDRSIATFCAPKTNLDKLAQIFFFKLYNYSDTCINNHFHFLFRLCLVQNWNLGQCSGLIYKNEIFGTFRTLSELIPFDYT